MPAPMPQGTTEPPMAHELRETLFANFMTYSPPDSSSSLDAPIPMHSISPSVMDGSQSSSGNADENNAGYYDRRVQKSETCEYYQTLMSQFSNLVLIATFAGGVQVAILSLINDLLSSLELELFPGGNYYSPYSLGILLGILAVALNLAVAVMAAVNAALASHLSLRPEPKAPNIEACLIFCMVVLFGAAVVSGSSLILLSINIDFFFTICVGVLFLSGVGISIDRVLALFGFNWLKRMYKSPLPALSLILSTVAFILAVARPDATMWFTIPNYYFTLTYHLLIVIQNAPRRPGKRGIVCAFILCLFWTACSIVTCATNNRELWYAIAFGVISGLEAITLASIGIVGSWKRRRQPQMNLAEA